mmetsp:Transcript_15154/g.43815  ORF Transcript_15154/g.43815 Transcript_15154/m.43815 type:complete len:295 (+) Transcript_15154:1925-2809(+)
MTVRQQKEKIHQTIVNNNGDSPRLTALGDRCIFGLLRRLLHLPGRRCAIFISGWTVLGLDVIEMTKTARLGSEARKLFRCSIDTNVPILSHHQLSSTGGTQRTEDIGEANMITMQGVPLLVFETFLPLGLLLVVQSQNADAISVGLLQVERRILLADALVQRPAEEGVARRQEQGFAILLLPAFAGGHLIVVGRTRRDGRSTDGGIQPLPQAGHGPREKGNVVSPIQLDPVPPGRGNQDRGSRPIAARIIILLALLLQLVVLRLELVEEFLRPIDRHVRHALLQPLVVVHVVRR